jgi:hypothetical protein
MSAKGSRRSAGITSTATQRAAEMSAACYDELPQRDPSVAAEISANQPPKALRAAKTENGTHGKTPFRALLTSTLPSVPPARDGLSSPSYVSFLRIDKNNHHRRYAHINVSQTLAMIPNGAPKPWHKPAAQRRAPIAARAQNERKPSGSRARARLSHLSHYSAERRRDWSVMRD